MLTESARLKKHRKQQKRSRNISNGEARCYLDIEIERLAASFENQFFPYFEQTIQVRADGIIQPYQGDNLTIADGRANYDKMKQSCYSDYYAYNQLKKVWVLVTVLGVATLISNIVFLAVKNVITIEYLFQLERSSDLSTGLLLLLDCIFIFLSVLQILIGKFFAKNFTVNLVPKIAKIVIISWVLFCVVALLTTTFELIAFKGPTIWLLLIHACVFCGISILMGLDIRTNKRTARTAKAFHDFLLDFRQTPRSKMLRRHLPVLEAVVEENSAFEQSQISSKVQIESAGSFDPSSYQNSSIFIYSDRATGENYHSDSDDSEDENLLLVQMSLDQNEPLYSTLVKSYSQPPRPVSTQYDVSSNHTSLNLH